MASLSEDPQPTASPEENVSEEEELSENQVTPPAIRLMFTTIDLLRIAIEVSVLASALHDLEPEDEDNLSDFLDRSNLTLYDFGRIPRSHALHFVAVTEAVYVAITSLPFFGFLIYSIMRCCSRQEMDRLTILVKDVPSFFTAYIPWALRLLSMVLSIVSTSLLYESFDEDDEVHDILSGLLFFLFSLLCARMASGDVTVKLDDANTYTALDIIEMLGTVLPIILAVAGAAESSVPLNSTTISPGRMRRQEEVISPTASVISDPVYSRQHMLEIQQYSCFIYFVLTFFHSLRMWRITEWGYFYNINGGLRILSIISSFIGFMLLVLLCSEDDNEDRDRQIAAGEISVVVALFAGRWASHDSKRNKVPEGTEGVWQQVSHFFARICESNGSQSQITESNGSQSQISSV